jgi:KaiC/GvpD/RAD55 family RecA-like ATPase
MSSAVRLPSELREFLSLPGPQTLLVRGPPGSGKSTLCLALLEASAGEKILVTSRVPAGELNREFPWLGNNGGTKIQVLDTTDVDGPSKESIRAAGEQMMLVSDEPGVRRSISEFLSLPPQIQEAWSRLPERSPSTVVIDSWDALIENYVGGLGHAKADQLDRAEIERMMLRRMARSRAHLVVVLEREEPSQLDYLVNGVVVTRREVVNDRLERWLQLPKLRGIRVANASYPYTVEGAKFQCIEPIRSYRVARRGRFEPQPDDQAGFLWPGSRSFAENFGRLPLGKLSLIETDAGVPDDVRYHIIAPAVMHALSLGGRVLLVPPPALSAEEIWTSVQGVVAPDRLAQQFRVIDVSGQLAWATKEAFPQHKESLVPVEALQPTEPGQEPGNSELGRWLRGGVAGGAPNLGVLYATGLEALALGMKIPLTSQMLAALPASVQASLGNTARLHLMAMGDVGSPMFSRLLSLAALHLRIHSRQGRTFIYGLKPWTAGLVVTESANGGPFDLLRIV